MIHSDRGSQYRRYAFGEIWEKNHLQHSMSRPGNPVENAAAEAFYKTLKTELIHPNPSKTKAQREVLLRNDLEEDYPNERIHTSLAMTPYQYEQRLLQEYVM
ncbi:hypothetical protein ABB02_02095 [Clostridiaceae bacterium JG1575]|nr:hypothetical protein ABB02_02095 [Clostridiaceae bacterium JG1575]